MAKVFLVASFFFFYGVHNADIWVVLGKCSVSSQCLAKVVGVPSGTSRSSSLGWVQTAIVATAGGVYTFSCENQLQVLVYWQRLFADTCGSCTIKGKANCECADACGVPGHRCALLWLLDFTMGAWSSVEASDGGWARVLHKYIAGCTSCRWMQWCRSMTEDRVWSRPPRSCIGPGFWCAPLWQYSFPVRCVYGSGGWWQASSQWYASVQW